MKPIVCVDLDGTLLEYNEWQDVYHFGEPKSGAREFLKALSAECRVVIFTTRCNPAVNHDENLINLHKLVEDYLIDKSLYFDEIYVGTGKPIAAAYVDDRAVFCDGRYEDALKGVRDRCETA